MKILNPYHPGLRVMSCSLLCALLLLVNERAKKVPVAAINHRNVALISSMATDTLPGQAPGADSAAFKKKIRQHFQSFRPARQINKPPIH